jgi:hypothetical protein
MKIRLTRYIEQTLDVDVPAVSDASLVDVEKIKAAAISESQGYFDTDWHTVGSIRYTVGPA